MSAGREVRTVLWGGNPGAGALSPEAHIENQPRFFEVVDRAATDIVTIGYASGSTGHPKGAMLTHRGVMKNSRFTTHVHGRGEGDTVVIVLTCAHVYGNGVMSGAFLNGMTRVRGATFGDNISPVSDTTIASATTQHSDLGGVVRSRLKYALAAAALASWATWRWGVGRRQKWRRHRRRRPRRPRWKEAPKDCRCSC